MAKTAKRRLLPKFGLRTLLLLVTLSVAGLFGRQKWIEYQRLENARQWVQQFDVTPRWIWHPENSVQDVEPIPTLLAGALHLESEVERITCLKIMAEGYPTECRDALIQVALRSKHPQTQRTAVHLISLIRDETVLARLDRLAKSDDPVLRAARIDCIGFTHAPIFREDNDQQVQFLRQPMSSEEPACVNCNPPILTAPLLLGQSQIYNIRSNSDPYAATGSALDKRMNVPERFRRELEKIMLADDSAPEERDAAARAIVTWPPKDYRLRYAEWGVWINNDGQFQLVDSIIDEIPDFVHRAGNNLMSFIDRLSIPTTVTKPVIHLSCDQPMAVDIDVSFNAGRPWFAYPRPHDFQVTSSVEWNLGLETFKSLRQFDAKKIAKLESLREGYPWMAPDHRQHYNGAITGLGLHWQSVIVSPTKLSWMKLPKVDPDPKYAWWSELRDVPCSWVSNLIESERFLYYDGPTLAKSPIDIRYKPDEIEITNQKIFERPDGFKNWSDPTRFSPITKPTEQRVCFYIRVNEDGVSGGSFNQMLDLKVDLTKLKLDNEDQLKQKMLAALQKAGLNEGESAGLLKCWTPAFFETPGQRVVFMLHRSEYDLMCPMDMQPKPTEIARVGLVLTELSD